MNDRANITEKTISASTEYKVLNAVADFANHKLNGVIKKYMANKMMSQKEPIPFPEKYKKRVTIFGEHYDGRRNGGFFYL